MLATFIKEGKTMPPQIDHDETFNSFHAQQ